MTSACTKAVPFVSGKPRPVSSGKRKSFRTDTISFQFGNEEFFVLARKSRDCAEAYVGTPHKQARRLTTPGRKRTVSGWKLNNFRRAGRASPQAPGRGR